MKFKFKYITHSNYKNTEAVHCYFRNQTTELSANCMTKATSKTKSRSKTNK